MMKDDVTGEVGWLEPATRGVVQRSGFRQYLALFVTIMFGVAAGILLAGWITTSVAQAPGGSLAAKAGHMAGEVGSELHTVYRHAAAKVTGEEAAQDQGSQE
jgi:hypothetical protein